MIDFLNTLDTNLFLSINGLHNTFFDALMVYISGKLSWLPLYFFLLYLIIRSFKWRSVLVLAFIGLLILAADQLSVHAFKNVFQRLRPCHNEALKLMVHTVKSCGGQYGFVSSHATNSFALLLLGITLFIGGSDATVARATPILEHLGRVIACGPLGTGNVVKLVTNQLWFVAAAAIGEGFALGMGNGVELSVLWDAITDSVGDSFVARHDAPSIFSGHYDPSFTLDLCNKDLGLIGELSATLGTDLPMTEAATATFTRATDRYGPHVGELHVARRIEDDTGLSFRLDGDWTPPWEQ